MSELVRIVEFQSSLSSFRATKDEDRAVQLELLIEITKPQNQYADWHPLIATPFRYNPPHPQARFRPPYGKNIFYGSRVEETALYEHAYHFIKERSHLKCEGEAGVRTLFYVEAEDKHSVEIKEYSNYQLMLDKKNYSASHQFIQSHPQIEFIYYPSCRDPKGRDNAAVLNIKYLNKNPKWESSIKFFYDYKKRQLTWLNYQLHIQWSEVS